MTDDERPWTVRFSSTPVRGLNRLPHKITAAIVEFSTVTLPEDPHRLSKPLRYELSGWRVARRGDYRITFRILDDDRVLLVGRVEHRAHIYKPR
ncbi:type II toxin-antitoxin system RelE/ParE family toxin [Mycobacterium sp.]|uniref:type II toxin-antitoxin system RelE family toxin n=1 Tax=Mycobacterium sp. TaxID=1785 RepID=UPI002C210657|nr:type II toxin-antitoxin system RelE/ParE family toxin [Mycobacterium sp.]HTQ22890.1 type II toxin-antitoxin system RelE/ParE family toxin [Mycobacterium sp.]